MKARSRKDKVQQNKALLALSAERVHQIVSGLIAQHFELLATGDGCTTQVMTDVLVKASVEGVAIEGTCNDLAAVPTGHTVRNYLNERLRPEELARLEDQANSALTADRPKRLGRGAVDLAADFHDEPFYGKTATLLTFACRGKAQAGTTYFYRIATLYHIHKKMPITLAVTFVRPEDTALAVLQRLLARAQGLGLAWRCLYLDKGFCNIPVLRFLQRQDYASILACPIRGKQGGTRALCQGRGSYITRHTFSSAENGQCTTTVAVVRTFNTTGRRRRRRQARWLVYVIINTTLRPDQVRQRYRSRFGVETSYRCMRCTHAKTTSRNPALRFFLLALAFILVNVWLTLRWRFCQIPRRGGRQIDKKQFELQRMSCFLKRAIERAYGTVDEIQAVAQPLAP